MYHEVAGVRRQFGVLSSAEHSRCGRSHNRGGRKAEMLIGLSRIERVVDGYDTSNHVASPDVSLSNVRLSSVVCSVKMWMYFEVFSNTPAVRITTGSGLHLPHHQKCCDQFTHPYS